MSAPIDSRYSTQETRRYLRWLAYQMVQHKQTVFYIEGLQPDWARNERRYRWLSRLIVGLGGGLLGGLSVIEFSDKLTFSFSRSELIFGLSVGLLGGLSGGDGIDLIRHIILRLTLAQEGVIPRKRYDRFLDHCAELGLLRKVGGGYIFRHRLLLEHLAQEYETKQIST